MSREILFRGKRIDNGEWEYGFLCKTYSHIQPRTRDAIMHENLPPLPAYSCAEIKIETVGQYTGLTDRNGKKIFEGDILLVKTSLDSIDKATRDDEYIANGVVVFNEGHFELEGKGLVLCTYWGIKSLYTAAHFKEYEVVGNIHDNPELLKGEQE